MYRVERIGMAQAESIKSLFVSVFTAEPWNDDWSDTRQLAQYIDDLIGQRSSLTYGLYEGDCLIGLSMGHIKHWYSGTEYCIDEFCLRRDRQGQGMGSAFLQEIEKKIAALGLTQVFLQTERDVPAYRFYRKNGYTELTDHVSFAKKTGLEGMK